MGTHCGARASVIEMPSVSTALLLRTDLFRDLESMKPLTIEEGGRQDPFDNRKLQSMMEALKEGDSTTDQYIAGGNVAWVSWSWSSTASVPVYKSSVKWIMRTTYKKPQPKNLVVAVDDLFMDQKKWANEEDQSGGGPSRLHLGHSEGLAARQVPGGRRRRCLGP